MFEVKTWLSSKSDCYHIKVTKGDYFIHTFTLYEDDIPYWVEKCKKAFK